MVGIFFQIGDEKTMVDAKPGDTLLEVAKKNGIKLFGGCDGAGVCGTCHVHIDSAFLSKVNELSPVGDEEADILDVVRGGDENSRLACQVVVKEEFDGMTVCLPKS